MIIIHATNCLSAERSLKRADIQLRARWNTFGLKRVDSGRTSQGFGIAVEIPELWNGWHLMTENELANLIANSCQDKDTLEIGTL